MSILLLLITAILFACSPENINELPQPSIEPNQPLAQRELAQVESLDIRRFDTFPVKVEVSYRGHLPDACTNIDQITQSRIGHDIKIIIENISYRDESCNEAPIPFEDTIEIDITNLAAGHYVVEVNGLMGTFTLEEDNVADLENAVISGRIREDICSINIAASGAASVPSDGCVESTGGSFIANGLIDSEEPGLGRVVVNLGEGNCPSSGLATTITDAEGLFLFSGLKGGTYCVTIDETDERNIPILGEGQWTYPQLDVLAGQTVVLNPSESRLDLNYGWDASEQFVFEPPDIEECTDKAIFITDITIPDGSEVSAGSTAVKTWQLRNIGSCTWDENYTLVSVSDDSYTLTDTISITSTFAPGEDVDVSITIVAPSEPGIYRSEWKIRNPDGLLFGIGPASNNAFWVQFEVVADTENE